MLTMLKEELKFEDVDTDTLCMEHFEDLRVDMGLDSVWSIWDAGPVDLETKMFSDCIRLVRYQFVRPDATVEEIEADLRDGGQRSMAEVTSFAVTGSIKNLWMAAESCIGQSRTHHRYIEDFEVQEDGSLMLITGS